MQSDSSVGLEARSTSSSGGTAAGARRVALTALALLALPLGIAAQEGVRPGEVPVTLEEAVEAALLGNGTLAASEARSRAASLTAEAGDAFLFPGISANAGVMRTDDPVGVFGTRLRQGRFTEADFALPSLNDPAALNDWTAGIGVQWEVGNPGKWVERDASQARSRAAGATVAWTREWAVFRTRLLYVEALRAGATLEAMEAARRAAQSTVERVERREGEGMATRADLLQARAAMAEMEARVQQASAAVQDARESLGNHLGWEAGRVPVPVEEASILHARLAPGADVGEDPPQLWARADLTAGRAGVEAARADVRAMEAARLPALQAFGMLSTHAAGPTDRRQSNWTVGLRVSVPVFTGFQLSRGTEAARAGARALELEHDQREREARTGLRSARRGAEAARGALVSARGASEAADEALRLLTRRYEEGMATVADLLQAEARAVHLRTGVVAAEADLGIALAALEFTRGQIMTQTSSHHEASDHE